MTEPTNLEIASSVSSFVIALAWASLARAGWWRVRARRGPATFARLGALLTSALAIIYFCVAIFPVVPPSIQAHPHPLMNVLYFVSDAVPFVAVAVFRQWTAFFALRSERSSWRWLGVNYGSATLMVALALYVEVVGCSGAAFGAYQLIAWSYMLVMLGSSVLEITPLARPGSWRPGSTSVARRPDVLVLGLAAGCMLAILGLHMTGSWNVHRETLDVMQVVLGATLLLPFAVRHLGGLLVGLGTNLGTLAGVGVVVLGMSRLQAGLTDPGFRPATWVVGAAAMIVVLGPWQRFLARGLDRLVLRRRRDRWSRLQQFLRTLSPELGRAECARLAVAELNAGMHLRGTALLLRDGGDVAAGTLALERVAPLWPRGAAADALMPTVAIHDDLMVLPGALRAALIDADVVGIVPLRGAHRLWGHLLLSTDLIGTSFFEDELDSIEAFTDQLARILDGADMLARVVAVERSLAHAEKLAAIGELAARIAHEIRNPVTAARSLAQTLSREPTSPLNAEHAELILTELTRVERQIAALLRFARREELRLEPADLGALVRETAEHFAARLTRDAIDCAVGGGARHGRALGRAPPPPRGRLRGRRARRHRRPRRPGEDPPGADQPDRERDRRARERRRWRASARAVGRGARRLLHAAGQRQRPGTARRRAEAHLRAVLLAEGAGDRARPRDRQAHGRGARRHGERVARHAGLRPVVPRRAATRPGRGAVSELRPPAGLPRALDLLLVSPATEA